MSITTKVKASKHGRSKHAIALDKDISYSFMSSNKYCTDAKDYFKNHKPYCNDIKGGK